MFVQPSRNSIPHTMKSIRKIIACVFAVVVLCAANADASTNYRILASSDREMIVEVRPDYRFDTVRVDGEAFVRISFSGAAYSTEVGAPMIPSLSLGFLLPSRTPVNVEVIEELRSGAKSMSLLPAPSSISTEFGAMPKYEIGDNYARFTNGEVVKAQDVTTARTAFAQYLTIEPVRYDAGARTVRLIESIKLRIRFYGKPLNADAKPFSRAELDFLQTGFVNGNDARLYRSAQADAMLAVRVNKSTPAYKPTPQAGGEWLSIEVDKEGVHKITMDDLRNAGITSTPGASSIELFGYGAQTIPDAITDSSGEWHSVAIDVRTDGSGNFSEFLFYAPGVHKWKYNDREDPLYGLFHWMNPYGSAGKFLLKVGGDNVSSIDRIAQRPDSITSPLEIASTVHTVALREVDRSFELPNYTREFVGELLPREGIDPLSVDLPALPGYTSDSTVLRVGTNGFIKLPNTFNVTLNGRDLGPVTGRYDNSQEPKPKRNWDKNFTIDASFGKPEKLLLNYRTNDPDGRMWLNWVEVFYRASTSIGNTSLPFFLVDTKRAFEFNFTNAAGGAVWDITDPFTPRSIAHADGSGKITASIQGRDGALRQFISFSEQSIQRVAVSKLSRIDEPKLRATIGQQGATNIIVTPEALLEQANELKALREKGGQATEPIKTAVILLEDIYREFGYGAKDPVAIRDFMAYVYRNTLRNGTDVPMFLTLFGSGHNDNQNRVTSVPVRIPVYLLPGTEHIESLRSGTDKSTPDDSYYGRLTPKTGLSAMDPDVGVGRLSAQTIDEAGVIVSKLKRYETSSATGPWRSRISMVIDDKIYNAGERDPLLHLVDAEATMPHIPSRMQINKVYGMGYQTVYTSGGRRKPEMEVAVDDAFNGGSIITGFIGHGNPKVWTHESIFLVPSTINKLNNHDKLTFVAMATCDFAEYDNYSEVSGGVQMLLRPSGGAVSMLGTSRSVYGGEPLYPTFFEGLFSVPCESAYGTNNVGTALVISKRNRLDTNPVWFYLQGDPAMRLLVPKQYAVVDSVNNIEVSKAVSIIPALSEVKVSGRISNTCDSIAGIDPSFNGQAIITLFDTKSTVTRVTHFTNGLDPWTDVYPIEGPILYRGSATVKDGRFTARFIVPRDIKFDTSNAKISVIAFADDSRSALGAYERVKLAGSDPSLVIDDSSGPELKVYIGTRAFRSGDVVPMTSNIIVDVKDEMGLNTSTASVGHSFIAWVDDASERSVNMAENYVSEQDNFRIGTATTKMSLPAGRHLLRVRAFDALNNPSFAEVEFVAKDSDPFKVYNATAYPNPMKDHMTVSFMHPLASGSLVDATLDIYSSDGRLVRTVVAPGTASNIVEISWDGDDDTGAAISQGAYTYRITVTDQNEGRTASAFGNFVIVK
ncbi:MAG TPA: type IX secretion system sortase PorU [Candidatus Kapabacteria bacterium]|nr:type IX secretion system sortase PorU [Candidatus Kapabacteria bacterium]